MWILFLLIYINFNTHGEYWLYSDSLSEHFEDFGSISIREKNIALLTDYFIEDNIYNTQRKYLLFPSLIATSRKMQLFLGYFHKTLLHGLILNQTHDIEYKRFRYIKGISAEATYKQFHINLFSGFPQDLQFDGISYSTTQDTQGIVRGISTLLDLASINISTAYLRLNRYNMPAPYAFSEIGGLGLEVSKNTFSFLLDAAFKKGVDFISYTRKKGNGLFLSMEFSREQCDLLVQLARYDSLSFYNINLPPVPIKTEILPSSGNSDKGGSFTLSLPHGNGNIEIGSGAIYSLKERSYIYPKNGRAYQEVYIETNRYHDAINYTIKTGYEHRLRIEPEYTHLKDIYVQSDIDLLKLSLECFLRLDRFTEDTSKYLKGVLNSTFYITSNLNIQLLTEYATSKIARYDFERFWPAVELSFNIEGGNISLFYGKQRGGLVCSGGMCRIMPKFNGLKLIVSKSI